jgi:hypothetical protein
MASPEHQDHEDLKHLLEETLEVEKENQVLLQKLYRHNIYGFIFRLIWFALLVGLPFALYFYILEPYFQMFGSSYEQFRLGVSELPGYKGLLLFLDTVFGV